MAALNLSLRGLTGSVYLGDGLTGEMHTRWNFRGGYLWRDDNPEDVAPYTPQAVPMAHTERTPKPKPANPDQLSLL